MSTFTPAETAACCRLIDMALAEDYGASSWPNFILNNPASARFVPPGYNGEAVIVARQRGIVAGLPAAQLVFASLDREVQFDQLQQDGSIVASAEVLARVRGPMGSILGGERTALNFLQHLSGIASLTERFVQAIAGLPTKILDTRKTLPGWRLLAKYAVRQGGGHNHRMGLYDGVLIKDNHIAFALPRYKDGIAGLLQSTRKYSRVECGNLPIEIEVDTLVQLAEVLPAKPDIVLLDNMTLDEMREAVRRRNAVAPQVLLEASGGINLQTVRGIAETGVDRLSVGALTHSAPALDIGLDYTT